MRAALRSLLVVVSVSGWLGACSTTSKTTSAAPAPPPSLRRQTVAVFPFANDGVAGYERLDFLRDWLADSLGTALQSSGELRVVERRELLKILQEQKLGSSALASKEGRLELGKIAGAQTLIFGNFAAVGDILQISARIVDVESGVILKSSSVHGSVDSARALGEDLSRRLAQGLGISIARAAQASGVTDNRALAEAELFYQGMRFEGQGESDRAIESYRQALAIDPNDREAKERLRKLLSAPH